MGFFKDFKADLSQAVNELSDDAVKMTAGDTESALDDVMVDTLTDEEDEKALQAALENVDEKAGLADEAVDVQEEKPVKASKAASANNKAADTDTVSHSEPEETDPAADTHMQDSAGTDSGDTSDMTAIITQGLKITGDIKAESSVELLGTVEGNVDCKGKLIVSGKIVGNSSSAEFFADKAEITGDVNCTGPVKIGSGSVIIGNLTATSAVIAGAIKGDIDVHGPVIVDTSAIVMGNIKSKLVQINNGAVIEGYCSQCYSDNSPKNFFGDK